MPNRFVCDVLKEMRKNLSILTDAKLNRGEAISLAVLKSLVEEAQTMVNRMEAALHDKNDLNYYKDKVRELKEELKELKKEKKELGVKEDNIPSLPSLSSILED